MDKKEETAVSVAQDDVQLGGFLENMFDDETIDEMFECFVHMKENEDMEPIHISHENTPQLSQELCH